MLLLPWRSFNYYFIFAGEFLGLCRQWVFQVFQVSKRGKRKSITYSILHVSAQRIDSICSVTLTVLKPPLKSILNSSTWLAEARLLSSCPFRDVSSFGLRTQPIVFKFFII